MRQHIKKLSVDKLDWAPTGTPGVVEKIINEDGASGARTLLLKSLPRPHDQITDHRPQFHPVDEEFFCLGGRFTLEGHPWITPGTYVYYPPYLVHGYGVDVPDGYEIYLRNSGALSTRRVDSPVQDSLYFVNGETEQLADIEMRRATPILETGEVRPKTGSQECSIASLREAKGAGEGAFIITLSAASRIVSPTPGYDSFLEIFVLSGEVEIMGHDVLSAREYAFFPPELPLELVGRSVLSACLVNYCGQNVHSHFARTASQSIMLPSA